MKNIKKKIGVFKEDDIYYVHYFKNGMIVSVVFNPIFNGSIEEWNKLPNGYKFK